MCCRRVGLHVLDVLRRRAVWICHCFRGGRSCDLAFGEALQTCFCTLTAAVKSLHPSMCIAVHCSILLHPQLPWYHESAHHWELRDQV